MLLTNCLQVLKLATCHWTRICVILIALCFQVTSVQIENCTNCQIKSSLQTVPFNRFTRSVEPVHVEKNARQFCSDCSNIEAGRCPRKTLNRIKRHSDKVKCQPENMLVKIHAPGPEYHVEPPLAKVKRCTGFCRAGFHSCLPAETSFIKVPVILTNHGLGIAKCAEYEIEQHEKCECDCKVQREHCSEKHRYERCSCKCFNETEKYECLANGLAGSAKSVWDEDECKCICEPEECRFEQVWNSASCRCQDIPVNDVENLLY